MSNTVEKGRATLATALVSAFLATMAIAAAAAPMPVAPASEGVEAAAAETGPTDARYSRSHARGQKYFRHRRHRRGPSISFSIVRPYYRPRYYDPGYKPGYEPGYDPGDEPDFAPAYRPPVVYVPRPDYGDGDGYRFRRHRRWDWPAGRDGQDRGGDGRVWRRDEPRARSPEAYRPPANEPPREREAVEPRRRFEAGDGARYPVQQAQPRVIVQPPRPYEGPRGVPVQLPRQDYHAPRVERQEAPRHAPAVCPPGQACAAPR